MKLPDPRRIRLSSGSTLRNHLFRDALRLHLAAPVARRYSGGKDINIACGLLAGTLR